MKARTKAGGGAALKRRLAALERQWEAGVLAPHEALALCSESDIPRHEWPEWIEPAIRLFSIKAHAAPVPAQPSRPITGPEQTRFLATMAEKLFSRFEGVSARTAARAATEAMREYGWKHGEKVVERVRREVFKLTKDKDGRALHYSFDWDLRALCKLAEQGKMPR